MDLPSKKEHLEEILDVDEGLMGKPVYDTNPRKLSTNKDNVNLGNYQSLKGNKARLKKSVTPNKRNKNKTPPPQRKPRKSKEIKQGNDFLTNKGSFKGTCSSNQSNRDSRSQKVHRQHSLRIQIRIAVGR